ncbi:MAG: glycosyltransferase family 39 protein [Pseudomonadota bacterium]|nr:glycosyltransferase family 39 protein [Pseudomonadota bacterium]
MSRKRPADEARWARSALIAMAAILAFRVAALALNRTDLMFDEAQYWTWSRDLDFGYFSKPPLIAWLIAGVSKLCGNGESCVRAPSPFLYAGASWFIFLSARRLYDARTGFWASLVFATLPGVSFSSGIISTDVPLLFFWSVALWGFIGLMQAPQWYWAAILGAAIGLGLNAKYSMAYFVGCALLCIVREPALRRLTRDPRSYAALLLALALLLPNLIWNARNGLATISHTADNANWGGALLHPLKMLEFAGAQFGVFGPVMFALLLWISWRAMRTAPSNEDRLLLWFSLPVLAVITLQALLSRAHANWAATAYPAASIVVTAWLLREKSWALLRGSLSLHACVMVVLAAGAAMAPQLSFPGGRNPYDRVLGWKALAASVRDEMVGRRYQAILTEDRWLTAELLYYLRKNRFTIRSWRPGPAPRDHFEMTRPYKGSEETLLLVSLRPTASHITARFEDAQSLGERRASGGGPAARPIWMWALSGYRGR